MPRGYNSLNDLKVNDLQIGLCPVCNRRLTAECEHIGTQETQEWIAAHIAAEQTKANERTSAEYVRMMESKEQTLAGWNSLVQQYAPKQLTAANPETCDHKREYAVKSGIQCSSCRQVREPANDFEKRLVSRLMPRDSGYVNYRF